MRCYLLRIQGIGTAAGPSVASWPRNPGYAAAPQYIPGGLAHEPMGVVSAEWSVEQSSMSTGRWRVVVDPDRWPVNLRAIHPRPISEVRHAVPLSTITSPDGASIHGLPTGVAVIEHARTNTQAGIVVGSVLYCGIETWEVTAANGGDAFFTATRGSYGSREVEHPRGSDIFVSPPALVGRQITLHEVLFSAPGPGAEVLLAGGVIAAEPSWDVRGLTTLEAHTDLRAVQLGVDESYEADLTISQSVWLGGRMPAGNLTGIYIWAPVTGRIVGFRWSPPAGHYRPEATIRAGSGDPGPDSGRSSRMVLGADVDGPYPAYRYFSVAGGAWVPCDHPTTITMCTLLSRDSTNWGVSDPRMYDLGDTRAVAGGLYPTYALGIDRVLVDVDAFLALQLGDLAGVRARGLWVGGQAESIHDLLRRLWAPLGVSIGTDRRGVWTPTRVGDAYPDDSTVEITAVSDHHGVVTHTRSRAVRQIALRLDPTPGGDSETTYIVGEADGARYYPEEIGATEEIRAAPYRILDYVEHDSFQHTLLLARIRRLARRLPVISDVGVDPRHMGEIDVGRRVSISDGAAVWDPVTGARATSPLSGQVISVSADAWTRACRADIIVYETLRLALHSPSGVVAAWNAFARELTLDAHACSAPGGLTDAQRFGDWLYHLRICDSHGVPITPASGAGVWRVRQLSPPNILEIEPGHSAHVPAAGDIVVLAHYSIAQVRARARYAYSASGGAHTTAAPAVGGDPPYVYGD